MIQSALILCFFFTLSVLLSGCETAAYYAQAVNGHAQLMHRAADIEQLAEEPGISPDLRNRLKRVLAMREFASRGLALPDNGSYRAYADLQRKAVVWSLTATPAFSVDPLQWCYPVIGCASYRAYFDREDAMAKASRLEAEGRDLAVQPVPAYSTLGWFDDPLPSTVIEWPEPLLAGLIFHELAHQQLYLAGDSTFNESYATAVEQAGIRLWLAKSGDTEQVEVWRGRRERERQFVALLLDFRERLASLYAKKMPPEAMRSAKQDMFVQLKAEYGRLKADWPTADNFDHWFEQPLNNARLASVGTYEQWVSAFLQLLRQQGGNFAAFHAEVERLSKLPEDQRNARLTALERSAAVR